MDYKQAVILRKDLALSKGKAIAQACHASLESYLKSENAENWHSEGAKKVVLEVETLEELQNLFQAAKDAGLPAALIKDAGRTEIPAGTITAVGIGPAQEEDVDKLTGELSLVK